MRCKRNLDEQYSTNRCIFDGTGNDKNNDVRINDGSLTNIGKLHEAYIGADKFYVEGVGTRHLSNAEVELVQQGIADKNDYYDSSAMAFGTGVKDKVNTMITNVKSFIANNPDSEVVIDVFGFSRGSTEARDFIKKRGQMITITKSFINKIAKCN
ncbi:hypothetical protein CPU12_01925 [Malaciobacter molluscorum LMG 25693]|uniref:T6SS Phospholipase effector Tle1-like catalytic domain-containing protein n=1 Tax=Malaciobacter molluscorum LMG 25693 TaxID=870501 RepID=A0A2G1DKN1_9BACT|nr:DUF2235 domain-containing protein [Malaciobacter molluscorum]AXX92604.1 hypothetical protein AMOL_1638 [Malaciobacter molluscorum LMG 25693]PHO19029.1 hypothetical protein CPU12_01925 [Malaciobacter molluscorum LMG 25693]